MLSLHESTRCPSEPELQRREVRRFPYNMNLLIVFAAVAETRSTTEAAKRLQLTQPAISHALARLRRDMEDPLFVRKGRTLAPTPRAMQLVSPVNQLLRDAQRIFESGSFDAATTTRIFHLALGDQANLTLARKLGRAFCERAPAAGLMIEPVSNKAVSQLLKGELDAIVGSGIDVRLPLRAQTLFSDSFVVAVNQDHPLLSERNGTRTLSLENYVRCKHIRAGLDSQPGSVVDKALDRVGLQRDVALCTQDYLSAIDMVAGSELVVTLPAQLLSLLGRPGVSSFPLPLIAESIRHELIWDSRCEVDEGLMWFTSLLLQLGQDNHLGARTCTQDTPHDGHEGSLFSVLKFR